MCPGIMTLNVVVFPLLPVPHTHNNIQAHHSTKVIRYVELHLKMVIKFRWWHSKFCEQSKITKLFRKHAGYFGHSVALLLCNWPC